MIRPTRLPFVDHGQLLDLLVAEDFLGALQVRPIGCGDEPLGGHDLGDRALHVVLEPQIAVGHDAFEEAPVVHHGDASDAVLRHDVVGVADERVDRQGDRILNHPALAPLHLPDLRGLSRDGHVLVDDRNAALAGHCDGHVGLAHCVHGGRDDRHIQDDVAGKSAAKIRVAGQHFTVGRDEQDVVIGESFSDELGVEMGGVGGHGGESGAVRIFRQK